MQAELFGLGTMAVGSMPVPPAALTSAGIVPGGGLAGTCGIEIEKFKAEWRGSSDRRLSVSRFFGRLRYPPR